MKTFIAAAAMIIAAVPALAHDIVSSDVYPGLDGYMDGEYFRPVGVTGPTLPELDELFLFIKEHSPVHTGLHPNAGEDVFTIENIKAPAVRFLTNDQMEQFAGDGMGNVIALYEEGYMYLNTTIDFSKGEDMSVLVHELVHHVQWFSGENELAHYQACPMHLERDAFRIQDEWMKTADVSERWVYEMKITGQIQGSVICYADRP